MTVKVNNTPEDISLQRIEIIDLNRVIKLETESYPSDEAASALALEFRIMTASELCYIAFRTGRSDFIGFVIGTAAAAGTRRMTHEMMKNHVPQGTVLCIHSVVIEQLERGKGYGRAMLSAYLQEIRDTTRIERVLLLSKPTFVPFYKSLGFESLGESAINHGSETWIELAQDFS